MPRRCSVRSEAWLGRKEGHEPLLLAPVKVVVVVNSLSILLLVVVVIECVVRLVREEALPAESARRAHIVKQITTITLAAICYAVSQSVGVAPVTEIGLVHVCPS